MRTSTVFALAVTLLCGISADRSILAQGRSAPPKPISAADVKSDDFLGTLDGNLYENRFFGLFVRVPEKYQVLNRAEVSVYANASSDLMKGGGTANDRKLDEAMQNQAILLMIAQLPPGNPGNSIFEMSVRKQAAGVTANMVLAESLKMMTASSKAVLKRAIPRLTIGGKSFTGFEVETDVGSVKLRQQFYVTIHRGYALVIAFTYAPGSDPTAFDSMLSQMIIKLR